MEIAKPLSKDRFQELHALAVKEAEEAGVDVKTFVRERWQKRAGLKAGNSENPDVQYKALREYLERET